MIYFVMLCSFLLGICFGILICGDDGLKNKDYKGTPLKNNKTYDKYRF